MMVILFTAGLSTTMLLKMMVKVIQTVTLSNTVSTIIKLIHFRTLFSSLEFTSTAAKLTVITNNLFSKILINRVLYATASEQSEVEYEYEILF